MKSHIWQVDLTPATVDQTCFPISELNALSAKVSLFFCLLLDTGVDFFLLHDLFCHLA